MPNTLAGTSSPYLQQHAEHPVDWQPWSAEALARAKAEDKPLLISIGYSSSAGCRRMAEESFEDETVAALMNERFVCVKVDREERPDIDATYANALRHLTGGGGWPVHAFATPDGYPFYAGTYFPPTQSGNQPSWTMLLGGIIDVWDNRRHEAEDTGNRIVERLSGAVQIDSATEIPGEGFLDRAIATLEDGFDSVNGGFGPAPRLPPATVLSLLLRLYSLPMARYTLTSMAGGGIFDQLAGGFSHYAKDEQWAIPQFEKLLSHNALLAAAYAKATDVTGDEAYGAIAERTLDFVIAELGDDDGGFASSLDAGFGADGVEGSYYRWTPAEVRAALSDDDASVAIEWFGVTGNGEATDGATALQTRGETPEAAQADRIVAGLLAARDTRERPRRDDKRIVSWNALTIEALVTSGTVLGRADHLEAAARCADLILERAADPRGPGRLLRLIPHGDSDSERATIAAGVLDDHAHLLSALLALYEATFETRWLTAARQIAEVCLAQFADPSGDGFFSTAHDHGPVVVRRKDLDDVPVPSGQATTALAMLRLHGFTGDARYRRAAEGVLRLTVEVAGTYPQGLPQLLIALDQYLAQPTEIAIVGEGPEAEALIAVAREHADPHAVIAAGVPSVVGDDVPLLAGRDLVDGKATAYVCHDFTCLKPVTSPQELEELLST